MQGGAKSAAPTLSKLNASHESLHDLWSFDVQINRVCALTELGVGRGKVGQRLRSL
jgi:hypothetical protein